MAKNTNRSEVRYALVDCDPGVDDALALAMGFASPFFRYDAVTSVHGNVSARLAYRNARRLTVFLRNHLAFPVPAVPVYPGASLALDGSRLNRSESRAIHGPEGLGAMFDRKRCLRPPGGRNSKLAWEVIAERAKERGSGLTIVTLGPLTNLALALRRAPGAFSRVRRIVVMGGGREDARERYACSRVQHLLRPVGGKGGVRIWAAYHHGGSRRDETRTHSCR